MEKALRDQQAGPQLRAAVRVWQSRPILTRLRRAMELVRRRVLPKSLLGQAIDYTLTRWETLTRYVDAGHLEIDNNRCENAIRPTAIGKKNFLFIGHPEAGQRSAVIYSRGIAFTLFDGVFCGVRNGTLFVILVPEPGCARAGAPFSRSAFHSANTDLMKSSASPLFFFHT